jgi:hypothetical protein
MTFAELVDHMARYRAAHPEQRMGQAYFNALHEVDPDIANSARGSAIDPFYNDAVMPEFMTFVAVRYDA